MPTKTPLLQRVKAGWAALTGRSEKAAQNPFNAPYNGNHWVGLRNDYRRLPGTDIDYAARAGDLWVNETAAIVLSWIRNALLDAPCKVWRDTQTVEPGGESETKPVALPNHPLALLLKKPNPRYSGTTLWGATYLSYKCDGNAYWFKNRVGGPGSKTQVVELWYMPHYLVQPCYHPDDPTQIYYAYYVGSGAPKIYPASDIVHFRDSIDPRNVLKGLSPLKACLRSLVGENEAATYTASILQNMGVPGAIATPKVNVEITVDEAMANQIKEKFRAFAGDNRGDLMVGTLPLDFHQVAWSPEQLTLDKIRVIPQATICAAIGVPATVAGIAVGDTQKTYNNAESYDKQAWRNGILPMARILADDLTNDDDFFPDQNPNATGAPYAMFDTSGVTALQEDRKAEADTVFVQAQAVQILIAAGFDAEEALEAVGLPAMAYTPPQTPEPANTQNNSGAASDNGSGKDASAGNKGILLSAEWRHFLADGTPAGSFYARRVPNGDGGAQRGTPPFPSIRKDTGDISVAESELYAAARKFRADLLVHEQGATAEMVRAWQTVETELKRRLTDLLASVQEMQDNETPVSVQIHHTEARLTSLLEQTQKELADLAREQAPKLADRQEAAITTATTGIPDLITGAYGTTTQETPELATIISRFNRLPARTVEALVGFAGDGSPLQRLLQEAGRDLPGALRDTLLTGISAGDSIAKIQSDMAAQSNLTRARLEAIARTEVLRAAREATRRTYQDNQNVVTGWIWCCGLGSEACVACWAMNGSEHPLSEPMGSHPSCRCSQIAAVKSLAEITGDESIPDTRPKIRPGAEIFAELSEAQQREILGAGGYELFRNGTPLSAFVHEETDPRWGLTRTVATLTEIEAR